MKDKILNNIERKIYDGIGKNFITPNNFEKEFPTIANKWLNTFSLWENTYEQLKIAQDKSNIVTSFSDFVSSKMNKKTLSKIAREFNVGANTLVEFLASKGVQIENNPNSKIDGATYQVLVGEFQSGKSAKEEILDIESALDLETLLWGFTSDKIWYNPEILGKRGSRLKTLENILTLFKEEYLSNDFIKLLSVCEKYLSDVQFSGSESCFVNFGFRNFEHEKSGWIKNKYTIHNEGISYSFSSSTKNEIEIFGPFVCVFILDIKKKRLQKIAITLKEVEQTTFIIWKEFEKISIKNRCEIYIEKHYGNETIIFDSRKEALEFYETIINIKEGRKPKY